MTEPTDWKILPILDRQIFNSLHEAVEDAISEILDAYLSDTPRLAAELRTALDEGDCDRIADLAHQIKPSSAALGASRVHGLSEQVESITRNGDTEKLRQDCQHLLQAIEELIPTLAACRDELQI